VQPDVKRVLAIGCAAAWLAVLLAPGGGAEPRATRIVDRTFSCAAGYVGGLHQVTIGTTFSTPPGSSTLRASSYVTRNLHEAALGSLSSEGISVHRRLCSAARRTVKLSTKGLRGGAVPPLGAEATCETPRRVLLRVRAVFARPVTAQTLRTFGFPQLVATGELEQAALAVGTLLGKPIAYTSVTGAETSRLFTLRTCKED
jgi:hypothetical protein